MMLWFEYYFSPFKPNPSLYAPEDPIFHQSAVHPTPQITTSYSANLFGDLYQMNQSNNYAPSVNNVQQPIIAQLLYNPTNGVDTTSFKKPILSSLRNKTTVSGRVVKILIFGGIVWNL